jgi:hypothetical protein
MTREYDDNKVTPGEVESKCKAVSRAPREKKLGKFYAYRSAGALERDQAAGYHWGYLTGEGKVYCTCGLILDSNDNETILEMAYPSIDLEVSPIVFVRGHRKLPVQDGPTIALIVKLLLINQGSTYVATAFCQGCGDVLEEQALSVAQEFVSNHDSSCAKK